MIAWLVRAAGAISPATQYCLGADQAVIEQIYGVEQYGSTEKDVWDKATAPCCLTRAKQEHAAHSSAELLLSSLTARLVGWPCLMPGTRMPHPCQCRVGRTQLCG